MSGKYSAIGNPKYQESSDNDSFSSFSKRYQEPTEDTPISLDLMHDRMRSSYHAFQVFCTNRFGIFMCFAWVSSFCLAIVSAVFYILYAVAVWTNPNILCVDLMRIAGMVLGILLTFTLVAGLVYWIRQFLCGWLWSPELFASRVCTMSVACFNGIIVITAVINIAQAPMVVKSSNNVVYYCGYDEYTIMYAQLVLTWPDQNCEFWPVDKLCGSDLRSFKSSNWITIVNGTSGAYRCQIQKFEGLTLCQSHFDDFSRFMYWAIVFSVLAVFFSIISVCIIRNPKFSTPCTEIFCCFPCCKHSTCCEPVDRFLFNDLSQKLSQGPM